MYKVHKFDSYMISINNLYLNIFNKEVLLYIEDELFYRTKNTDLAVIIAACLTNDLPVDPILDILLELVPYEDSARYRCYNTDSYTPIDEIAKRFIIKEIENVIKLGAGPL